MESRRPGLVVTVPARHLGVPRRLWRMAGRLLVVTAGSFLALNVGILLVPFPLVHVFTVPLAVAMGPLAAYFTWRTRALLGPAEVACPRCGVGVPVPDRLAGWPARMSCGGCGVRVELNLARPAPSHP
jgi:ribosomal protein S27AE